MRAMRKQFLVNWLTFACMVVFVGPVHFVFNVYPGRKATCPLFSCSNKNDGHGVPLTGFYRCL